MPDFKVVDHSEVPGHSSGAKASALSLALESGQTVFLAGHTSSSLVTRALRNKASYLRARGYHIVSRQGTSEGVAGLFIWTEKAAPRA